MIFFVAPSFLLIIDESDNWRTGADLPRCTSFLSARGTARSLRHFDQRAKYLGKITEGWRQPSQDCCTGLAKKSRLRKMDGLRKCIAVDNHEAVKVGDVEKNMESFFFVAEMTKARNVRLCAGLRAAVATVRTQLWQPLSAYERHHTISGVDKLRWSVTASTEYCASV